MKSYSRQYSTYHIAIAACLFGLPCAANATSGEITPDSVGEVRIVDCDGYPRAAAKITAGSSVTARAWLKATSAQVGSADAKVILSRAGESSQEGITADSGVVSFDNLTTGEWKVCPSDRSLSLAKVSIEQGNESGSLAKIAAIGAGVGGIAALGLAGSSGSSDSSSRGALISQDEISTSQATSNGLSSAGASTSAGNTETPRPLAAADDCLNNQVATPVSPFS
jgi:hypothetical protein